MERGQNEREKQGTRRAKECHDAGGFHGDPGDPYFDLVEHLFGNRVRIDNQ